jgi:hypothetical protein
MNKEKATAEAVFVTTETASEQSDPYFALGSSGQLSAELLWMEELTWSAPAPGLWPDRVISL